MTLSIELEIVVDVGSSSLTGGIASGILCVLLVLLVAVIVLVLVIRRRRMKRRHMGSLIM